VPIAAPAGSDGDLQKGTAWPNPRFSDNSDGTVTDNLTGLTWLANANCTDTVGGVEKSDGILTWPNALTWSNSLSSGACGLTDNSSAGEWRLPNRRELDSLIDLRYSYPPLSNDAGTGQWADNATSAFSGVISEGHWSSSTYANDTDYPWFVDLSDGRVGMNDDYIGYRVWPVRD